MLPAGTRVGPYEVVSWLGAGGMGEVYRAWDTTLDREVALKTLPEEELASQPERLARLRQEARILASLNHPGIAILHGLEESDGGVPVLVMELVEGETLADRLRRGALPWRDAVTVAHQIALALEAAHDKGILHRDLKPGNIRLAPDGRVKLLDFGLAKAVQRAALDSRLDTDTSPHSEPGAVLGTAPYMSPEQARGQEADRRTDIWAFGCVLYEMLTGKRAFEGTTYSDTVAAILDREPDWKALPQEVPTALVRLLRRCLQKEKDKRLRDIGDARLELEELLAGTDPITEARPGRRRDAVWPVIAILAALLGGFVSWAVQRPPPSVRTEVLRLSLEALEAATTGASVGGASAPVLSPAGDRIVYNTPSGLVVRELDKAAGRLMPETVGSYRTFFSPDGKWLGFNRNGSLKKVSLTGGAPLTVCNGVPQCHGATWCADDTIVFTPDNHSGLWQVPASGGEPRELTTPDRARGEKSHRWPHCLPGGKAVLFTVGTSRLRKWDDARIDVLRLPSGERRTVLEGGTSPAYVDSGHLVYRWGTSILAAPFDVDRLATTAAPVAVVDGVQSAALWGAPFFTVARTGVLAFVPHRRNAERMVLVNRTGEARPLTREVESVGLDSVGGPRLSPDGRVIALTIGGANDQVWRFDLERDALSQVTFEWDNNNPVWTPDGESLIVSSTPGWKLRRVRADGSGNPEPLVAGKGSNQIPGSVTADGKLLAYCEDGTNTLEDIWITSLEHDGEPRLFVQTPSSDVMPAISPGGDLLAYASNESGKFEIYLRAFPDGGRRVQVSSEGGIHPVWARNGKELFYRVPLGGSKWRMMAAKVTPGKPIRISRGGALFEDAYGASGETASYDVLPDGQHFVMIEVDREASRITHFNVILNWFEELKRLVPPK
jgi:eukaryotic-like serine/threonine-protein kinase